MDQFGVLVESIGFKSQSRSAPLAKLKSQPDKPNYQNAPSKPLHNEGFEFVGDNIDKSFQSYNSNNFFNSSQNSHDLFGGNDVFGGPFSNSMKPSSSSAAGSNGIDLDAFFVGNSSSNLYDDDDIFGLNSKSNLGKSGSGFDDLIPGFGQSNPPFNNGENLAKAGSRQSSTSSNLGSTFPEVPLSIFESSASTRNKSSGKNSSSIDELEDFAMGRSQNSASEQSDAKISKEAVTRVQEKLRNMKDFGDKRNAVSDLNIKISFPKKDGREPKVTPGSLHHRQTEKVQVREQRVIREEKNTLRNEDDLEILFGKGSQTTNDRKPISKFEDPVFGSLFNGNDRSKVEKTSSQTSHSTKKAPSTSNYADFSFFGEPAPSAVEFFEIDGEPEERRKARFNHHMKTKERMAKALAEKNQRDLLAQQEQEERRRLAESMDGNIKHWAAGKEGNLRALLSSLQYVLWPECGWQAVSLTDLITSVSVKKVYHKATLCVHPDKVQQKGASVQQKYIAEKVFDVLKEAWNKFNAEELR